MAMWETTFPRNTHAVFCKEMYESNQAHATHPRRVPVGAALGLCVGVCDGANDGLFVVGVRVGHPYF